jgi:hypothetical protein
MVPSLVTTEVEPRTAAQNVVPGAQDTGVTGEPAMSKPLGGVTDIQPGKALGGVVVVVGAVVVVVAGVVVVVPKVDPPEVDVVVGDVPELVATL